MRVDVSGLSTCPSLPGTGLAVSMTVWASLVQERIPADRLGRTLSYSTLSVPCGKLVSAGVLLDKGEEDTRHAPSDHCRHTRQTPPTPPR